MLKIEQNFFFENFVSTLFGNLDQLLPRLTFLEWIKDSAVTLRNIVHSRYIVTFRIKLYFALYECGNNYRENFT